MIATEVLHGDGLRLVPLALEHVPALVRWNNDRDVLHWLHRSEDSAEQLGHASVEAQVRASHTEPTDLRYMIETNEGVRIGDIGLIAIHPCGRAELTIRLGEKAYWSRGHGTDAIRCVLRYAFGAFGLRRVTLIADADNVRGIRCYERCGFVHEGLLRAHRLRYGKPLDMVAMAVLREEFLAREADVRRR